MMQTPFDQPDEQHDDSRSIQEIIIENEILLMKLTAEFGAKIFLPDERVEPEIENHFLRSVYAFEKSSAESASRAIVFDIIGRPAFPHEASLTEEQVKEQIRIVRTLLHRHRIVVDQNGNYPARVIYRFLTEEFFCMEILRQPGENDCYMHFCYEDYHPDHEHDLRQAAGYFTSFILDGISFVPKGGLYNRIRTSSGLLVGHKEALRVIRASFADFMTTTLQAFELKQVTILEEIAFVEFDVCYVALLNDNETITIRGQGEFEFILSDELWWVCSIRFPGIVI